MLLTMLVPLVSIGRPLYLICNVKVNTSVPPMSEDSRIMWQWGPSEYLHRNLITGSLPGWGLPYLPFTADCLQQQYFCDLSWQTFSFSWIIQWARLLCSQEQSNKNKQLFPVSKLTFHFLFQHLQHQATKK